MYDDVFEFGKSMQRSARAILLPLQSLPVGSEDIMRNLSQVTLPLGIDWNPSSHEYEAGFLTTLH
jgi:hypothetical protein